jgi:RNA polymerase sigma-70 factor, ECF subfamily
MRQLPMEECCAQAADDRLVARLKGGDKTAFIELYEHYKRSVYLYCLKMLGETEAAKDVTQGVFLKVLERNGQLADASKFRSWLLTIARNDCLTQRKDAKMTVPEDECSIDLNNVSAAEVAVFDKVDTELKLVNQAVGRLRPDYRDVVILREYQNLSYRQIAEVIGAAESTVKFRLFAARRELYESLRPLLARLGS